MQTCAALLRGCSRCRRVMWLLQRKLLRPPSINTLPHPLAVNHLSPHTCSLPQWLSLIPLKTQPDFYYHYYSELPLSFWMGGGLHRLGCSHNNSALRLKSARWRGKIFHSQLVQLYISKYFLHNYWFLVVIITSILICLHFHSKWIILLKQRLIFLSYICSSIEWILRNLIRP